MKNLIKEIPWLVYMFIIGSFDLTILLLFFDFTIAANQHGNEVLGHILAATGVLCFMCPSFFLWEYKKNIH